MEGKSVAGHVMTTWDGRNYLLAVADGAGGAFVDSDRVRGASVGDSCAWLISPAGEVTDLTARQRRRPLLGSGEALPLVFDAELNGARLLVASQIRAAASASWEA
jgi:hypothetical protein